MRWITPIVLGAALAVEGFCFDSGIANAAEPVIPNCKVPASLTELDKPLPNTRNRLAAGDPVKIVAIGSSSTAGAGASIPDASYPSRLAIELSQLLPNISFTVVNRGVNGQESGDMVARIKPDVLDERPALVIWQLGTNSVLRDHPINGVRTNIDAGIAQIKEAGADVILVDPQFVPRVIAKPETEAMVRLIEVNGKRHGIGVFHRYAMMRYWHEKSGMPFEIFTSPDGLHMNDWSYGCWAKQLSTSIVQAVARPTLSAQIGPSAVRAPAE